ncbi:hypothetical protein [Amycolatopsis sp. NPDC059021]|uniref:hypothetical protein n=1 Tax=Amycolatopsis sp. NPDC059021 TaxID=3346704 RepID=UPI00367006BF
MTAVNALGDFGTIDYCSLLDLPRVTGAGQVVQPPGPSFEWCRAQLTENNVHRVVMIGPLSTDVDPNLKPYDSYAGPTPSGVSVQQSAFNTDTTCTRVITFADGIRLNLSVTDVTTPGPADARCAKADAGVGGALAAITAGKVGRLAFPDKSWGRVDPCPLIETHDLDAVSGPETKLAPALSGHSCIRGKVSLRLSVDQTAPQGPAEALGGREARVSASGAFCTVDASQAAPGPPGRNEKAELIVVETAGDANDATCAAARSAASVVFPKLP